MTTMIIIIINVLIKVTIKNAVWDSFASSVFFDFNMMCSTVQLSRVFT